MLSTSQRIIFMLADGNSIVFSLLGQGSIYLFYVVILYSTFRKFNFIGLTFSQLTAIFYKAVLTSDSLQLITTCMFTTSVFRTMFSYSESNNCDTFVYCIWLLDVLQVIPIILYAFILIFMEKCVNYAKSCTSKSTFKLYKFMPIKTLGVTTIL